MTSHNQCQLNLHQSRLTTKRNRLTHERTKLLQAHYAGAIPLELLKTEQDRITGQLETIEGRMAVSRTHFDDIERNLTVALDLATDCYRAYMDANDQTRRLLNQAFFERFYVDDEPRADLAEPFRTLLGPEILQVAGFGGDAGIVIGERAKTLNTTAPSDSQPGWSLHHLRAMRRRTLAGRPNTKPPRGATRRGGSKENYLVPPAGFEPALSLV
jgi:site-specific DNA recombinase